MAIAATRPVDQWGPHAPGTGPYDEYGDWPEQMARPERITRLRTHEARWPETPRPIPLTPEDLDRIAGWPEGTTAAIERGDLVVSVSRVEDLWLRLYRRREAAAGVWIEVDGHLGGWNGPAVAGAIRALARRHNTTPEELCWQAGLASMAHDLLRGHLHRVDIRTLRRLARAAGEHLPE